MVLAFFCLLQVGQGAAPATTFAAFAALPFTTTAVRSGGEVVTLSVTQEGASVGVTGTQNHTLEQKSHGQNITAMGTRKHTSHGQIHDMEDHTECFFLRSGTVVTQGTAVRRGIPKGRYTKATAVRRGGGYPTVWAGGCDWGYMPGYSGSTPKECGTHPHLEFEGLSCGQMQNAFCGLLENVKQNCCCSLQTEKLGSMTSWEQTQKSGTSWATDSGPLEAEMKLQTQKLQTQKQK